MINAIIVKRLVPIAMTLFIAGGMRGQQQAILNQSAYNLYLLSPAAAGLGTIALASCHYKRSWLAVAQGPENLQLTIDGPVREKNIGLGLNLRTESAGLLSRTQVSGAFRYGVKLNGSTSLSFGLEAGFARQALDFSAVKAAAPEELAGWQQASNVLVPVFGSGIAFRSGRLSIACSARDLFPVSASFKTETGDVFNYKTLSEFAFSIQRTFPAGDHLEIMPHCTFRSTYGLQVQPDVLLNVSYRNSLLVGGGYRPDNAIYFNIGIQAGKVRAIYTYELNNGEQVRAGAGHEISVRFSMPGNTHATYQPAAVSDRNLRELLETMDEQKTSERVLKETIDSLDKNLKALREEVERLKNNQLSHEEIVKAIDQYFDRQDKEKNSPAEASGKYTSQNTKSDYRVVNPETESDYLSVDSAKSSCRIVLGVYQLAGYAREYQKFLKRVMGYDTRLFQLTIKDKEFIYVCLTDEYNDLSPALVALRHVRREVSGQKIKITKGQPWILQKFIK